MLISFMRFVGLIFLAIASWPSLGSAVEGVLEVNQACATQTGCFSGDSAGFPVTISSLAPARNIVLTSDLDLTSAANTSAISATVDHLTIDLNGFAIRGSGAAGSGLGIDVPFADHTVVRNGLISGMGSHGIHLDRFGQVRDVTVVGNGGYGIFADLGGYVSGCIAWENGLGGISANSSVIEGNSSTINGEDGIDGGNSSIIRANSMFGNGGDGIEVRSQSIVRVNASRNNGGYGLYVPSGTSGYAENAIAGSISGLGTVGEGVAEPIAAIELGTNLCGGTTVCP